MTVSRAVRPMGVTSGVRKACTVHHGRRYVHKVNHLVTCFATFFYTGFFPFAPATFATFVFLLVYAVVPGGDWIATYTIFIPTLILSVPAATALEKTRGKDPHCVVIDEIVGIQVALVGATPTYAGIAAAFVLFRIFDVWKPFPIYRLQAWPGGWGIVADDIVAGVYTRGVLMALAAATHALGRFHL
jgi:phosphatidylglycerophosphatase A